jgi:hypothetical protein
MQSGKHGTFFWAQKPNGRLDRLLGHCPALVEEKFVIVTSLDSGPLRLQPNELAAGWTQSGQLAYSPRIARADAIPREGYDEWYIFTGPPQVQVDEVFANSHFELHGRDSDPGKPQWWFEHLQEKQERFWNQIARLQPQSYVAEGDLLTVATQDHALFESVMNALSILP